MLAVGRRGGSRPQRLPVEAPEKTREGTDIARPADPAQPLRVAMLVTRLVGGGAERQMVTLAELLPRELFQVEFLALSGAGELDDRARAAGITVHYLDTAGAADAATPMKVARRARKTFGYVRAARAGRYDVIDAWLPPNDVLAALLRKLTKTPAVVAGRRNLSDFGAPRGSMSRAVRDLANRHVDAVVVNSEAGAADVLRHEGLRPPKVKVIRNGVRPIPDLPGADADAARRQLGFAPDDLVVGCVASLTEVKRVDLVLQTHAELLPGHPRLRLLIVGGGALRDELELRSAQLGTQQAIRFTGNVADPEKLVGLTDVIVQASRTEGLPNALLEAASAGRAIVATDVGGTREVLDQGRTGLLVPPNDSAALGAALERLLLDPVLRRELGQSARAHVGKVFGIDRFVREFADLYRRVVPQADGTDRDP